MKKFFAFLAVAMLALCLVACGGGQGDQGGQGGSEGKTINLTYSGTASDKDFNLQLFEDFKAARKAAGDKNTYVIEYLEIGPDKVDSTVLDWAAPNAPDVYEYASDKIAILFKKGALAKLGSSYAEYVTSSMSEIGVTLATINGEIYAYPYTGDNTYYLQYDKSAFTAEEVVSMEGLLAAANERSYQVGYDLETAFWGGAAMFTFGADYDLAYDEDGNLVKIDADFDGAKGLMAAKAIYGIMKDPAWVNTSGVPAADSAVKAVIGGTWSISSFKELWGDNYGCAVMPTVTVDGQTANLGCFLGGKCFGVNPQRSQGNADRFVAANELAKFLSGKECQTKRYETFSIYPCHLEAQQHPAMATDENIIVLKAQSAFAHAQTAVPAEFWNAPANLMAGIKDDTYTLENLQDGIVAFNKAVKGETEPVE